MSQKSRILIVDDSVLARMMARDAVESAAPEAVIVEAVSGADALERIAGDYIDLAPVDLNMPGMDGMELALELRRRCAGIRLALCTANLQDAVKRRAEEQDIHFIGKPINADKVASFLTALG